MATPSNQPVHELDILLVHNPDVSCTEEDVEHGNSHDQFFRVLWGKHPHDIAPGQTKRMPRFLAEHFAKYLATHMLTREEERTGKKSLVFSSTERPKMVSRILLGVESYFQSPAAMSPGAAVGQQIDELNERPVDIGLVNHPLMGELRPDAPSLDDILKTSAATGSVGESPVGSGLSDPPPAPVPSSVVQENLGNTSLFDPSKAKPSKAALLETAHALDIPVTGRETVDQLIGKVKSF